MCCWPGASRKLGRASGGSSCEEGSLPGTEITGTGGSSSDSVSDPSENRLLLTGWLGLGRGVVPGGIADHISHH